MYIKCFSNEEDVYEENCPSRFLYKINVWHIWRFIDADFDLFLAKRNKSLIPFGFAHSNFYYIFQRKFISNLIEMFDTTLLSSHHCFSTSTRIPIHRTIGMGMKISPNEHNSNTKNCFKIYGLVLSASVRFTSLQYKTAALSGMPGESTQVLRMARQKIIVPIRL